MSGLAEEVSSSSSPLLGFMSISPSSLASPRPRDLRSDERGLLLIHLLLNCATHVAAADLDRANAFLEHISPLASPHGDTMQRIAACFASALARRLLRSWPGLYRALNPPAGDEFAAAASARRVFLDVCPFMRLSFLVSNQAILEAMEGEKVVHLIDLGGSDASQWLALLQCFACRPEGPPHLRVTAVGERRDVLLSTASVLSKEAERLDVPFQFNAIVADLDSLNFESLRVKTGEAVGICSVLRLHSLLAASDDVAAARKAFPFASAGAKGEVLEKEQGSDSSSSAFGVSSSVKMESFLASVWSLSPKIMVVTEQESDHNAQSLNERFVEALNFYAAMFDCLESTLPRQSAERLSVEKRLFGEEIRNIMACEGLERKERHEKLEKWAARFEMAGFRRLPLSYYGMLQARRMLQSFGCEGYRVKEENGCFLFCWQDRALFSVSAWRFRRFD